MELSNIADLKKSIANGTAVVKPEMATASGGEGSDYSYTAYMVTTPSGFTYEAVPQGNGSLAIDVPNPQNTAQYRGYFNFDPNTGKTSVSDPSTFMQPRTSRSSGGGGLFGDITSGISDFLDSDIGKVAMVAAAYFGGPAAVDALTSGAVSSASDAIAVSSAVAAPETAAAVAAASPDAAIAIASAVPDQAVAIAAAVPDQAVAIAAAVPDAGVTP